ncbi:MAG: hypothetical protein F6K36_24835 [Symploca sp. SIO3C6]|nr:hypothetical protein [Symploca sp. SIO3C6]
MNVHSRLTWLKKFTTFVGVASISTLMSTTAWAQSNSRFSLPKQTNEDQIYVAQSSPKESLFADSNPYLPNSKRKASEDEIQGFCERFPYNSMCSGNTTELRSLPPTDSIPEGLSSPRSIPSNIGIPEGESEIESMPSNMEVPEGESEVESMPSSTDMPEEGKKPEFLPPK